MTPLRPDTLEAIVDAVRAHPRVVAHGARTKAPLVAHLADAVAIDLTGYSGVTEYEPQEYTFTARAGTPVAEIEALLAEHGQYLPFDPPFSAEGATIGGTVAAGLNGPGRLRYGGLRDFIIGVYYVDGTGTLLRGGGKVVKNAAGFDVPKLLTGSAGRLGVIAEVTFKVFPAPRAWRTLRVSCADLDDAVSCVTALGLIPLELEALELEPPGMLLLRVSGDAAAVDTHARRVATASGRDYDLLSAEDDAQQWRAARAFAWVGERGLVKVPITPRDVRALDDIVARQDIERRYGVGCNVAWLVPPAGLAPGALELGGRAGLFVRGPAPDVDSSPWIGNVPGPAGAFARAIKRALDPDQRFPALA